MTAARRLAIRLLAPAACACAVGAAAQPQEWALDPDLTRVHWEVRHYDTSTVRGRFDRLTGRVLLDREARSVEVSITVDTASVSTGSPVFDRVLRRADMLATDEHPQAWFVARRMTFDGERVQALQGELTLRGTSRPLTITARHFGCRPAPDGAQTCGGDFEGTLRRSDFGVTYGLPFGADEVRLLVTVQATRR